MYAATGGPNVKWGGTDFKWGTGTTGPPLATTLRLSLGFHSCNSNHQKTWPHCSACIKNNQDLLPSKLENAFCKRTNK